MNNSPEQGTQAQYKEYDCIVLECNEGVITLEVFGLEDFEESSVVAVPYIASHWSA